MASVNCGLKSNIFLYSVLFLKKHTNYYLFRKLTDDMSTYDLIIIKIYFNVKQLSYYYSSNMVTNYEYLII